MRNQAQTTHEELDERVESATALLDIKSIYRFDPAIYDSRNKKERHEGLYVGVIQMPTGNGVLFLFQDPYDPQKDLGFDVPGEMILDMLIRGTIIPVNNDNRHYH